jgi:hypothetical protein
MNASTSLTPNVPYHIKLVIADRNDYQSDSAIFLSSNSFNIGQQVLGSDLTVAANTAICVGQTTVLDSGLSPSTYSFVWKKDGVVLSGQTGPTLTVSQAGNYELTYTNSAFPCQTISDSVLVEYLPAFQTTNPRTLNRCNTGQASYTYNLSVNTTLINNGVNPAYAISYHTTLADANSNSNALPTAYSSPGNQTIYVRINSNSGNSCYVVKSFQLALVAPAVANQPNDYTLCSNNVTSTEGTFNLGSLNGQVLNGQNGALYYVTYYPTLADANAGTNQLPLNYNSSGTTIYPRVSLSDDPSCFGVTTANLIVSPLPLVDSMEDVITCTSYTLPALTNGNYFTGSNGSGTALFAGDIITVTQIIYIYNENLVQPFCDNESNFNVTIIIPDELEDNSGTYCDGYTVPSTTFGDYHTAPNGGGTILTAGTVLTTNQTIYFYFASTIEPFVIDISSDIVTYANGGNITQWLRLGHLFYNRCLWN